MNIRKAPEKLAEALLLPINPSAVIILGLYTVLWGLWVLNPWAAVFGHAALYHIMAGLAPEPFWGGLAILCGIITTYGAYARSYHPLIWGSVVAFLHWFTIACLYFIGDPVNTGGITALTFAIYAAYIYLNIHVNFRNDRRNKHLLR